MNEAALLLLLLNFAYIGLLPVIFFKRDGRLSLMWWLTAAPFFTCSLLLIAGWAGSVAPAVDYTGLWGRLLAPVSVLFSAASIALISYTRGTHRIPIALWHQENDAPRSVVTYGAYARIRHPFYASFILALFAALLFFPHALTLLTLLGGSLILNLTAAREERRLCASEFGSEYREYVARTGRFWPKMRAGRSAVSRQAKETGRETRTVA